MSSRQRRVAESIISSYEMNNHVRYNECAVEGALKYRTDSGIAPIDPKELMDLFKSDVNAAWALVRNMNTNQRMHEAMEVAAYLEFEKCTLVRWIDILNKWNAKIGA